MTVSSRTTDRPMSIDSRRSSINGGSGTTISSTTAMTAAGASKCVPRIGAGGAMVVVIAKASEHQLFDADQVRKHFGNRTEQLSGNHIADLALLVERARKRRVFHNRDGMVAGNFANLCGDEIRALGDHDGRGGLVAFVFERHGEVSRIRQHDGGAW